MADCKHGGTSAADGHSGVLDPKSPLQTGDTSHVMRENSKTAGEQITDTKRGSTHRRRTEVSSPHWEVVSAAWDEKLLLIARKCIGVPGVTLWSPQIFNILSHE